MTGYFDLLLPKPLPDAWFRALLFGAFVLHFAFVLFTIGTAIIALTYYVRHRFGGDETVVGWDKHFLSSFFAHKSLAIVLGVGPILLMQIGNSIPFITASNLLAPLWLGIVPFLLTALILLEALHERHRPGGLGYLAVGIVGVAALLAVPATFAAVVSTTERPTAWQHIFTHAGMPRDLAWHWLLRLTHVVGAALVFTAALHLIHARWPEKRAALGRWIMGGLAFQIPVGVALFTTLPRSQGTAGTATLLVGVAAAVVLVWLFYRAAPSDGAVAARPLSVVLLVLLSGMLLTRQIVQDRLLVPLDRQLQANALAYHATVAPKSGAAVVADYRTVSEVPYDNPLTIYARSCHFCHGAVGNGQGNEAVNLFVPPEDLTGVRTGFGELSRILRTGIPGTAMPNFAFYTEGQLQELMGFLRSPIGLAAAPEPLVAPPSEAARAQARTVFTSTCATCHGQDGKRTPLSRGFSPAPPDLTLFALSTRRELEVLAAGYPGTMMPSFAMLPEETRLALVERVHALYRGP